MYKDRYTHTQKLKLAEHDNPPSMFCLKENKLVENCLLCHKGKREILYWSKKFSEIFCKTFRINS